MRRSSAPLLALCLCLGLAGRASAETILFVGNSFTFGACSPVWKWRAETVTDLNGEGQGGAPALFKRFTEEAGLDYQVSLETHPGIGLDWHVANALPRIDRAWDHVVLQGYSTLDAERPGDPTRHAEAAGVLARAFQARNARVDLRMTATWSRPDLTYRGAGPWAGRDIFTMAADLRRGVDTAAARTLGVRGVAPVGEAFSRAIREGVADPNPYDGVSFGQVDLWAFDHYHASAFGYYLEALVLFGSVTGRDPTSLGERESAARELGFSPDQTRSLQRVAAEELGFRPPPSSAAPAAPPR